MYLDLIALILFQKDWKVLSLYFPVTSIAAQNVTLNPSLARFSIHVFLSSEEHLPGLYGSNTYVRVHILLIKIRVLK